MTEVLRLLTCVPWKLQSAQSEQVFIESTREHADVRPQFLRDELFKNFRKRVAGAVLLIASCLINKSDDPHASKSPKQDFALNGDMLLLFLKCPGSSSRENRIANVWKDRCRVAERDLPTMRRPKPDGTLDHLHQLFGDKRRNGFAGRKTLESITTDAAGAATAKIEARHHAALSENAGFVLQHVTGDFDVSDLQRVIFGAVRGLLNVTTPASGSTFLPDGPTLFR